MAKICFTSLNYAPEPIGIGPYSQGWAEFLAERGHDVSVVCGVPYYPQWARYDGFDGDFAWTQENGVHVMRVPHYIPSRPGGLQRMGHYVSFARNLAKGLSCLEQSRSPDAVIAIAPALIAAPVADRFAKRHGALSWLHIQDFEVEAAVATGLLPGWATRWGKRYERAVLRRFDYVSSIAPAMIEKAAEKRNRGGRPLELRNWAEPAVGGEAADGRRIRQKLGLPEGLVALYSGNLARKQGIGVILEAAQQMRDRTDLIFVICGEGPAAAEVERSAKALPNLHFRPLQPRADLPDLLDLADMHLLPQIAGAADLVLPSKLANMLASGKPVVTTANPGTSLAEEAKGCGKVVPSGDDQAFASAIEGLAAAPEERRALGIAARKRADEWWSKKSQLTRFADSLERAIGDHAA